MHHVPGNLSKLLSTFLISKSLLSETTIRFFFIFWHSVLKRQEHNNDD